MATMSGADPDQLDDLARLMAAAAQELRAMQVRLSERVQQVPWAGRDADRIRGEWAGRHARAVTVVATDLDSAATVVHGNAVDQRQASSAAGGALTGPAGGPAVGPVAGPGVGPADAPPGPAGPAGPLAPGQPLPPDGGLSRTESVAASGELGPLAYEGEVTVSTFTGSVTPPEVTLGGPTSEVELGEEAERTFAEASIEAEAKYALVEATAEGKLGLGPAELSGEASVFEGAQAKGEAGVSLGPDGLAATAGVSALVGATAAASATASLGGASVTAEGHLTYGLELKAEADAEISYEHVEVSLELAAALGLGGGGKISVEFDPSAVAEELGELLPYLW